MPKEGRNRGNITTAGQTAITAGAFTLGAGWGSSTKAVAAGSCDHSGSIAITAVTGGGLAQATATVDVVFASAFSAAPTCPIVTMSNDNSAATNLQPVVTAYSTTGFSFTCSTVPVNSKIYTFAWFVPSRA